MTPKSRVMTNVRTGDRSAPQSHRFIAAPRAPGALDAAGDGSPVIVVGTGLTMLGREAE
jgi:uncharacterized NAD(P)/FAD-binding protein YdhS